MYRFMGYILIPAVISCMRLVAKKEDEKICIGVKDNGAGMTPETIREAMEQTSNRIGLGNVIRRIQLLYGERGGDRNQNLFPNEIVK